MLTAMETVIMAIHGTMFFLDINVCRRIQALVLFSTTYKGAVNPNYKIAMVSNIFILTLNIF
jgi:hypothetical protein